MPDGGPMAGRVAVIAGGGGAIGGAIARRYAAEGASVLIRDISREKADAVDGGQTAFEGTALSGIHQGAP